MVHLLSTIALIDEKKGKWDGRKPCIMWGVIGACGDQKGSVFIQTPRTGNNLQFGEALRLAPRVQKHVKGATVLACVVSVLWCSRVRAEDQPSPIVVLEISEECGGAATTVELVTELARQLPTAQFLLELDEEVLSQPNRDIWQVYARMSELGSCELWLTHGVPIFLGPDLPAQPSQILTGAATEIAWFVEQSASMNQPPRMGVAGLMNPLTVRDSDIAIERAEVSPIALSGLPLMDPLTLPPADWQGEFEVATLGNTRVALGDLPLMDPVTLPAVDLVNASGEPTTMTSSQRVLMEPVILPGPTAGSFQRSVPAFIDLWVPSERPLMDPLILPDHNQPPEFTVEPYVPSNRSNPRYR